MTTPSAATARSAGAAGSTEGAVSGVFRVISWGGGSEGISRPPFIEGQGRRRFSAAERPRNDDTAAFFAWLPVQGVSAAVPQLVSLPGARTGQGIPVRG